MNRPGCPTWSQAGDRGTPRSRSARARRLLRREARLERRGRTDWPAAYRHRRERAAGRCRSSRSSTPDRRQDDIDGPSWDRTRRQQNTIADRFVAAATSVEHPRQHRHIQIGVVVHPHFPLSLMQAVQPTGVLGDRAAPRDGQRQEQRVQACVVESLSDVPAGCHHHPAFPTRDGRHQTATACPASSPSQPAASRHARSSDEPPLQPIEMVVPFRQHEGRPAASPHGRRHRRCDCCAVIVNQFAIERLEFDPLVGSGLLFGTKAVGRTRTVCSNG